MQQAGASAEQWIRQAMADEPNGDSLAALIAARNPGAGPEQLSEAVGLLRGYIEQVVAANAALAAQSPANPEVVRLILGAAEQSHARAVQRAQAQGPVGALHGAYAICQVLSGAGLVQPDFAAVHQAVRSVLDASLADEIDRIAAAALKSPRPGPGGPVRAGAAAVLEPVSALAFAAAEARSNLPPDHRLPGAPDRTLAGTGLVVVGLQDCDTSAVTALPDGAILAAGTARNESGGKSMTIVKLDPSGRLDPGFASGGCVQLRMPYDAQHAADCRALAIAVQADGRIVIAGSATAPPTGLGVSEDLVLARLTAAGELDPSFGASGWLQLDLGMESQATGVLIEPDGRIAACGFVRDRRSGRYGACVLRVAADGKPDPSFGDGGLVVLASESHDKAVAIARERDGRLIVLARQDSGSTSKKFLVARLHPDGSADSSFGRLGRTSLSVGSGDCVPCALAVADGHYLVAGYLEPREFILLAFGKDGRPDPAFGEGGFVRGHFPAGDLGSPDSPLSSFGRALAIQPDGGIVLAGSVTLSTRPTGYAAGVSTSSANRSLALARFDAGGQLDRETFGVAGFVVVDLDDGEDEIRAIAIDGDRLTIAGISDRGMAIGRILAPDAGALRAMIEAAEPEPEPLPDEPEPLLDPSFGDGGLRLDTQLVDPAQMAIDGESRILVCGMESGADGTPLAGLAVARFTADGRRDPAFGDAGLARAAAPGPCRPVAMLAQDEDALLVLGQPDPPAGHAWLARFDADGRPGEPIALKLPGPSEGGAFQCHAMAEDARQRLIVAGRIGEEMAVARFVPTGDGESWSAAIDEAFGALGPTAGLVTVPFGGRFAAARCLRIDGDGRILIGGTADVGQGDQPFDFAAARIGDDGAIDAGFGSGGTTTFSLEGTDDSVHAMLADDGDAIVLIGESYDDRNVARILALRSDAGGLLDRSYNGGAGFFESDFPGSARAAVRDSGGGLFVAGSADGEALMLRLSPDGALDRSFGDGGRLRIPAPGPAAFVDLACQSDGGIVAAARLTHDGADHLLLVRVKG